MTGSNMTVVAGNGCAVKLAQRCRVLAHICQTYNVLWTPTHMSDMPGHVCPIDLSMHTYMPVHVYPMSPPMCAPCMLHVPAHMTLHPLYDMCMHQVMTMPMHTDEQNTTGSIQPWHAVAHRPSLLPFLLFLVLSFSLLLLP